MTDLSPAAQAVLDAAEDAYDYNYSEFHRCADRVAAAALRAAADYDPDGSTTDDYDEGWRAAMAFVEAIAAELEGAP